MLVTLWTSLDSFMVFTIVDLFLAVTNWTLS